MKDIKYLYPSCGLRYFEKDIITLHNDRREIKIMNRGKKPK